MNFPSFKDIASMCYFLCVPCAGIFSYTSSLRTIVRSFFKYTRLFVQEYSFQVQVLVQHLRYANFLFVFAMNPESEEAKRVNIQRTEGNSTESAFAIDPVDQIFDRVKSYIDTKLGAFKTNLPVHEDGPDAESKKFRREVEAKKTKN